MRILADLPMPDVTELQTCAFRGKKSKIYMPDIHQKYVASRNDACK
jgi:hypothetical protein